MCVCVCVCARALCWVLGIVQTLTTHLTVHNERYVSSIFDRHVKVSLTTRKKRQTQLTIDKWPRMVKEICNDTYSYNTVPELRELYLW